MADEIFQCAASFSSFISQKSLRSKRISNFDQYYEGRFSFRSQINISKEISFGNLGSFEFFGTSLRNISRPPDEEKMLARSFWNPRHHFLASYFLRMLS